MGYLCCQVHIAVCWIGRSWVKLYPSATRNVDLNPAVRIGLANDVVISNRVVFAHQKAVDQPSRHARGSQKNRHRGGEVFTMSRFRFEQKRAQRMRAGIPGKIQSVYVVPL